MVPRLSRRLSSQLPALSATSTWDSWPSFYIPWYELLGFFHSKRRPSKTSSLLRCGKLGRGGHVGNTVSWSCSLSAAAAAPGTPQPLLPPQPLFTPSGFVRPHLLSSQPWHVAAPPALSCQGSAVRPPLTPSSRPPPALRSLRWRCSLLPAWLVICSQNEGEAQA